MISIKKQTDIIRTKEKVQNQAQLYVGIQSSKKQSFQITKIKYTVQQIIKLSGNCLITCITRKMSHLKKVNI